MSDKYHLFYHRADLDGIGSAICVLAYLRNEGITSDKIILHAWNYGEEVKQEWDSGDNVIIVDCCLDTPTMKLLKEQSASGGVLVQWIDHHKTSKAESEQHGFDDLPGIRVEQIPAAIALSHQFFIGGVTPEGITLLSEYDTWQDWASYWAVKILPFQFGMRHYDFGGRLYTFMKMPKGTEEEIERADDYLSKGIIGDFLNCCGPYTKEVMETGDILIKYQTISNKIAAARAFSFRWHGLTFACINQGGVNSQAFDSVSFAHDAAMLFAYNGKLNKWTFSLYGVCYDGEKRGKTKADLSQIAKLMGGGGHAQACGFEVGSLEKVFGCGAVEGPGMTEFASENKTVSAAG